MREFFLTDIHYPNEEKEVVAIAKRMIRDIQPDLLWLNGDILDNEAISPFDKTPESMTRWAAQKQYAINELTNFRNLLPKARIVFKAGNHCAWLMKYILRNAPAFQGETSLTWPKLLKLDELDIEYIPDTVFTKVGRLLHIHGHEKPCSSVFPAKGLYDKFGTSLIAGHFHRHSFWGQRTINGDHAAYTIACARSFNVDFDKFVNWQHGFAVNDYSRSGFFHVNPIMVIKDPHEKRKCAIFEGKIYYANKICKL